MSEDLLSYWLKTATLKKCQLVSYLWGFLPLLQTTLTFFFFTFFLLIQLFSKFSNCSRIRHGVVITTFPYKIMQIDNTMLSSSNGSFLVSGKKCLCEKQIHANLPWNQAVSHLKHSNNATKAPCILLLGVYSSDSIGFRDERAGVGGYESKSWMMDRKKAGEWETCCCRKTCAAKC